MKGREREKGRGRKGEEDKEIEKERKNDVAVVNVQKCSPTLVRRVKMPAVPLNHNDLFTIIMTVDSPIPSVLSYAETASQVL